MKRKCHNEQSDERYRLKDDEGSCDQWRAKGPNVNVAKRYRQCQACAWWGAFGKWLARAVEAHR